MWEKKTIVVHWQEQLPPETKGENRDECIRLCPVNGLCLNLPDLPYGHKHFSCHFIGSAGTLSAPGDLLFCSLQSKGLLKDVYG